MGGVSFNIDIYIYIFASLLPKLIWKYKTHTLNLLALQINVFLVRTAGSGKAMKLGSKTKDVDSFVSKLRSEGTGENSLVENDLNKKM